MHVRTVVAGLALAVSSPLVTAVAQRTARDTARVTPMIVTATRSPLATDRAPASVTVITGAQLRAEGITTVVDALRQVPGVSLAQTGSYGGATSLFIRGGESKFTKVLIDGVPVNDAGGAYDFSALTTDNIERIEIVRGPASVLYGSDAVAGVIQLFTRRGTLGTHGDLAARGGGFGSYDVDGAVRGSDGSVDYSLGGARHETRGFQAFNSGFRDDVGSALLGYVGTAGDARISMRYRDSHFHYPTDGSGLVVDSNAVRREGRLSLGLDAGVRLAPRVEVRLALASHNVHGISDDQPDSPGDAGGYYFTTADRSTRRSGDLRVNVDLPAAVRLTVGGTIEREWQESGTVSNFGDTPTESHARRTSGAYAQLLLAPTERYSVTLGGRYEHNERFGDFGTARAAASLAVRDGTRLRGSIGTAFREPTFLENYGCCGFVQGNPDLAPEHGVSVDAGIEQDLTRWATIGAALFSNSFRDLIDYRSATTGPNYVNVARTRTRGVELEARATLPEGWHGDASFTYLDARVIDPGAAPGATALFVANARLLRRPMHSLDAGVGYRNDTGGLDGRALRVGTREDNYFAPDFTASHVTLPAYARVDLSGDIALLPRAAGREPVSATLRVENLFDAQYTEVAGFNFDGSQGNLSNTGYRAAPRRVLGGLRFAF
jgi:vitamin B12 transporter